MKSGGDGARFQLICCLLLLCCCLEPAVCTFDNVKLVDNGYEGVVIAINPEIAENPDIISSLKVRSYKVRCSIENNPARLEASRVVT